ncbi:MAG: IS66 family insertion sequence element accessory protein TnpB [Variovorax sp.]
MIRIDAVWLAVEPVDMRAGAERLLASVVNVFGAAQAHHGYLFANARANRIKLLVHDGFGVWCAARRLNVGGFEWPQAVPAGAAPLTLTREQFDALVLGLPWQRLEQMQRITRLSSAALRWRRCRCRSIGRCPVAGGRCARRNCCMLDLHALKAQDLRSLSPEAMARAAEQMLAQLLAQSQQIAQQAYEIKFKDAKLEKVMFELARLKAWKFGAKTEAMNAEQRRLFEETLAEDEANLQAQLERLQAKQPAQDEDGDKRRRSPKRQALPEHLRRVEHPHEPADTNCPSPDCGRPMVRVGEDVSERLDIVPAEFFVHRHIYGKWACRCCQRLVQEAAAAQIIDGGIPAAGLVAHTLISRFVDHLP